MYTVSQPALVLAVVLAVACSLSAPITNVISTEAGAFAAAVESPPASRPLPLPIPALAFAVASGYPKASALGLSTPQSRQEALASGVCLPVPAVPPPAKTQQKPVSSPQT